jgi:hypothetical protein
MRGVSGPQPTMGIQGSDDKDQNNDSDGQKLPRTYHSLPPHQPQERDKIRKHSYYLNTYAEICAQLYADKSPCGKIILLRHGSIQLQSGERSCSTCHCERSNLLALEIAGATGILPVICDRQAGTPVSPFTPRNGRTAPRVSEWLLQQGYASVPGERRATSLSPGP